MIKPKKLRKLEHRDWKGFHSPLPRFDRKGGSMRPQGFRYASGAAALGGDANHDGIVNVADLGILATNYGLTGRTWAQGDFTGDGLVNVADLGVLATNFGLTQARPTNVFVPGTGIVGLPDPPDGAPYTPVTWADLFRQPPSELDINQLPMGLADCYLLSAMIALAYNYPMDLPKIIGIVGDKAMVNFRAYPRTVRFDPSVPIRVYSSIRNMWAELLTKAWTQTVGGTYARLSWGSQAWGYSSYGYKVTNYAVTTMGSDTSMPALIKSSVGKPMSANSGTSTTYCPAQHSFAVLGMDADGRIVLANPWAFDGTTSNLPPDSNPNDGTIRLTWPQFKTDFVILTLVNGPLA